MSGRGTRPPLTLLVTLALVVGLLAVPLAALDGLRRVDAAGPVSGAIGLGGGLSGSIDERTGLFSVSVPVVSVAGPGSAGVSWSLVWDQARAVDGVDRSGFGAGWSLGASFVETSGAVQVFPANGGVYREGGTYASNLEDYPLQDVAFRRGAGEHPFELAYDDGRVDGFDGDGNLVSRVDRFGNQTTLTWVAKPGRQWAPSSITDGYGLTTNFAYSGDQTTVTGPARSDGVRAATTITLDGSRGVSTVQDPSGATASFEYTPVAGSTVELLTTITSTTQAKTHIRYQDGGPSGLVAVASVATTDASNNVLGPVRLFSLNPAGNDDHTYTGYPTYSGATTDELFASRNTTYRYTTEISSCVIPALPVPPQCPSPPISTLSTYDSQHRLVQRDVKAGAVIVQHQTSTYPPIEPGELGGNYARPLSTTIEYAATSSVAGIASAAGTRTVTTNRSYDQHGRVLTSTDETGTTTAITYDERFGLIGNVTITGADGSRSVTSHTLSADGTTIQDATTAYAEPGQPLTARTTTSYLYDQFGQPHQRTMTWAPGAKPAGDSGGPDTVVTTFDSAIDAAARTRTITTTTAVGTPDAAATTSVLDLVSGRPVRSTDALGRVTSYAYDEAARRTSTTTPDGLTTTTSYGTATAATSATRTDTSSDGHVVLTGYDPLGRKARITDNVHDQAFTASPTARQLSAFSYSLDGTTTTATDQHGRTITTKLDVLGRQVQQVGATGITHTTAYDDAAHTTAQGVVPVGASDPVSVRTTAYDDGNRAVTIAVTTATAAPTPTRGRRSTASGS